MSLHPQVIELKQLPSSKRDLDIDPFKEIRELQHLVILNRCPYPREVVHASDVEVLADDAELASGRLRTKRHKRGMLGAS